MSYIGKPPAEHFTSFATQTFSVSATTSYTLDHAVANENEIALFVNNVRQQPGSGKAYTATGTALTLSAATASTDTMYCIFLGRALQTVNPATNSISTAMISDNAITAAKISASLGKVLQVQSTLLQDDFSSTSTSFTDVTDLSLTITPAATSSKILLLCNTNTYQNTDTAYWALRWERAISGGSTTNIGHGTYGLSFARSAQAHDFWGGVGMTYLDSPSTTSEITYQVQASTTGSGTMNISVNSSNSNSIIALEIGA